MAVGVGQVLDIAFELRESFCLGGDCYRSACALRKVIVRRNDDLGESAELAHPDLPMLVGIDVAAAREPEVVAARSAAARVNRTGLGDRSADVTFCDGYSAACARSVA